MTPPRPTTAANAVALLMQAGSLALGEMDALRECKAKTAAANLYRAMIGF